MEIISHRGYWLEANQRNQPIAFQRSFDLGYGTETDVRDCGGRLVISHDMPTGSEMTLDSLLDIMGDRNLPLAINIKADGLAQALADKFKERGHTNWFVFDMAVPDMRSYFSKEVCTYTRLSDVEPVPAWLEYSAGIWLDHFSTGHFSNEIILSYLEQGKKICIVSPELHGRDYISAWTSLLPLKDKAGLMICTDKPEQAHAFFRET
ncbi:MULTISPECIES: PI-PLC domain-containing protein [Pseudomonadaceae]|uniref:phosphodiesterase n=1 Tax=Pseudomonadaceae TaxID=135621 RepID=UPI0005CB0D45|nr:phosphodiesterase [Pseudomonas sp. FeS53a]MBO2927891.1 phosphodiesterase [Pseudomonas otitidis]